MVLHYVDGDLAAKDMDLLETPVEEAQADTVSALVKQYYGGRGALPRQILLPCELEDEVPITRMLSEACGHRVYLLTPPAGGQDGPSSAWPTRTPWREVERATSREERQSKLMEALGRMLALPQPPRRIEAYDISNTGDANIVALHDRFRGRPAPEAGLPAL